MTKWLKVTSSNNSTPNPTFHFNIHVFYTDFDRSTTICCQQIHGYSNTFCSFITANVWNIMHLLLKAPFCLLMNPHWISIHQSCFISELEQAARMAFLPGLKKQINKVRSRSKWRSDFLKILLRENQSLKEEKKQWSIKKKYMVSKYFHFQANQFMSERISGVEGTKLDDDFHRWGRQTKSS